MSKQPSPTFFGSAAATASLEWMRLRRSHRATLSMIAAGLVTSVVLVFMMDSDTSPRTAFAASFNAAFLGFLDLLLGFLCCAQVVAEEVESRTIGYLLIRPAPRGALVLGKLAAGYGMAMSVLTVCFIVMAIGSAVATSSGESSMLPTLAQAYGAVALHTLVVCTICLTCGAIMPEAAGVLAILYLGFFEFTLSFAPYAFRLLSPMHHASLVSGVPVALHNIDFTDTVPVIPTSAAGLVLVMITLSALVLAMFVVGKREYRYAST